MGGMATYIVLVAFARRVRAFQGGRRHQTAVNKEEESAVKKMLRDDCKRKLGAFIRARREHADSSLVDLASACGSHPDHLAKIEAGKHIPRESTLMIRIAKALNVN